MQQNYSRRGPKNRKKVNSGKNNPAESEKFRGEILSRLVFNLKGSFPRRHRLSSLLPEIRLALHSLVYRPRIILTKVEGFFSLPLDGGGLRWT
jgi:hypothetical protein